MISLNQMKDEAIEKLRGNWGNGALVVLIAAIISIAVSFIPFAGILVGGPLALGMASYFLKISRREEVEVNTVFDGFKQFGNAIGASLLMGIIVVIGFILLIVPGVIAALALSQTYRIMHDEPSLGPIEAMKKSHEIMKGHRGDYFVLQLSFIGWALLAILTIGIGFFFLAPYVSTTSSIFYNQLIKHEDDKELQDFASHLTNPA